LPVSAVDIISPAFQHAKQQLIQPFRIGQWTRLALIGLLAGELGSGGCSGRRIFTAPSPGGGGPGLNLPHINPAILGLLFAVILVTGLVLWVVLTYVSSICRFILFDSVIKRRCEIRVGWRTRQAPGFQYFLWQIGFALVIGVLAAMLLGLPLFLAFAAGWFKHPSEHIAGLVLGGLAFILLALALGIVIALVHVLTKDFVVPQMALENIGVIEGWRRLLAMMEQEKGGYAAYVGMKIVLAIVAAILISIATFFVVLLLLIPVGGLGLAAVFAGKAAGITWNVFTITAAIVAGLIVLFILFYLVSLVSVPAIVFFPAYSIYFFAARYPPLSAVLYPRSPPAPVSPLPGTPPPTPIPG
jgi:hypothetical protein